MRDRRDAWLATDRNDSFRCPSRLSGSDLISLIRVARRLLQRDAGLLPTAFLAVCVPLGARLVLEDILSVYAGSERGLGQKGYIWRTRRLPISRSCRFANGRETLLHQLAYGEGVLGPRLDAQQLTCRIAFVVSGFWFTSSAVGKIKSLSFGAWLRALLHA